MKHNHGREESILQLALGFYVQVFMMYFLVAFAMIFLDAMPPKEVILGTAVLYYWLFLVFKEALNSLFCLLKQATSQLLRSTGE